MIIGIDASRAFGSDRTGTENYSYHLISHILRLPASRTHHFVLFTRPGSVIPDSFGVRHAEVVEVAYSHLWTQVGLARETWKRKLDVLWVPAHTLPVLRRPGIKTVVTIHGLEYQWLPEYNNLLQRWYLPLSTYYAARSADHLIAVSAFTKNQLVEMGTPTDKITVIHEGVEIGQSENSEPQIVRKSDNQRTLHRFGLTSQRYILFVGTVQPRKNLATLIAAFSRVKMDIPEVKLVIAGGKGWMTEDIFAAPTRYDVQDSVIFTGRVTDQELEALYSNATVAVQPSLQEGFGLPVLEAMGRNLPVIASDGGALPEVMGDAGSVVPLRADFDVRFAEAMTLLLRDATLRRRYAYAGRQRVRDFTWDIAAERTLSTLITA